MPIVTFLPWGKRLAVPAGTTVLEAERLGGILQDAPCGGSGKCGKCKIWINGREALACRTPVDEDMTVTVSAGPGKAEILAEGIKGRITLRPVQEGRYHAGVDIGTTTVVAYLLDGVSGEIADTCSMLNPQFPYGADVISRIQAAVSGGLQQLTEAIREGVWSLLQKLCQRRGISAEALGTVAVVANPAMQQIFFGVSPENLARPPFIPYFNETKVLPLAEYFPVQSPGKLLAAPVIAGYVGADTVGCILASGMYREERMTLLVDIGTNGEMALGNRRGMAACSTAAGPALEGGRISCGMRGCEGAIDHLWMENGQQKYSVIGSAGDRGTKQKHEAVNGAELLAKGLCGSGLIDAVALLLEQGVLNRRGRIQKSYRGEGKFREYELAEGIFLTQDDIREVQMAKGAVAAGIALLAEHMGISVKEIERVVLCGAFGSFMNPANACRIGLLPKELLSKIEIGGNAAGMGGMQMALDRESFFLTNEIVRRTEPLELAALSNFQRVYAANMLFEEAPQAGT